MQDKKYKIAIVGYRLNQGGLEKVMSSLSVYFSTQKIEVHIVILEDDVVYPYSGVLVNIGKIKKKNKGILGKLKAVLFLKKYLSNNQFDFIIDFRYRINFFQEFVYSSFIYNSKTIYTIHSSRLQTYLTGSKWLGHYICKNKKSIVCVSKEITRQVAQKYELDNVVHLSNPVDFDFIKSKSISPINLSFSYIIAAGRFDENNTKQFDQLIIAYSKTSLPEQGISLLILGSGMLEDFYKQQAIKSNVADNIHFLGFKENPYPYFKNAKFLVLCSKHEGFPMTLLEALACGTPVVSFDCISGPDEMICHRENGLLVENQNFEKLTQEMNLFIEDQELYNHCKNNAKESIEKFSIEKIGARWLDLMKIEIHS
jgi:glycosyltransferase involved in cell wall biosynthesis